MKGILQFKTLREIPLDYLSSWIILDLDNTLLEPESDVFLKGAKEWVFHQNLSKVLIVTNSPRNLMFVRKELKIPIYRGKKPFLGVWKKIQKVHGLKPRDVVVIGDRLFTDGLFGKRIGCRTILVAPQSKREFFLIKLSRILEHLLLR